MGQSLWVREVADYDAEGDHIICRWEGTEWIMSPAIAQATATKLSEALAKLRIEQSGKVEDMAHWRDHAASP